MTDSGKEQLFFHTFEVSLSPSEGCCLLWTLECVSNAETIFPSPKNGPKDSETEDCNLKLGIES